MDDSSRAGTGGDASEGLCAVPRAAQTTLAIVPSPTLPDTYNGTFIL
jgi:hypothetical protein